MIIAFNKPYGVVSQFTPLGEHPTLAGYGLPPNVYACGRLDHDSEGLLLLTDDGALQHRLSDPRHKQPKTYWAEVERLPSTQSLATLAAGVILKDGPTRPCAVRRLDPEPELPPRDPPVRFRRSVPTAWIELVLTEGRNRQVRRMTAAIAHPTLRLARVAIGSITWAGLPPGAFREVLPAELRGLAHPLPHGQRR